MITYIESIKPLKAQFELLAYVQAPATNDWQTKNGELKVISVVLLNFLRRADYPRAEIITHNSSSIFSANPVADSISVSRAATSIATLVRNPSCSLKCLTPCLPSHVLMLSITTLSFLK